MLGRKVGNGTAAVLLVLAAGIASTGTVVAVKWQEPVPAAALAPPPVTPSRLPLLTASGAGTAPSATGLRAALAGALRDPALGGSVSLSILDATSGTPLLEAGADRPVLPASTAKIATAVAALTALPRDRRLVTRVMAGRAPGEVVLVGAGDTTLSGPRAHPSYPVVARLADLARATRAALAGVTVTRVTVDDSLYSGPRLGPGWRPAYVAAGDVAPVSALSVDAGRLRPDADPRAPDPALAAGAAFAGLLSPRPVPVGRGTAPDGATELAAVSSPPLEALVQSMLVRSDNDLAESLARQVALARGQPPTFAGVAVAMRQVLAPVLERSRMAATAVQLVDGSGLSRLDRLQPGALTRLLAAVSADPTSPLAAVVAGLPVAGFDGTLEKRYRKGPGVVAAGQVRAKTGTLDGVSALAGLLRTSDGAVLAFDLTATAVPHGRTLASQVALDRLAALLVGCGCP